MAEFVKETLPFQLFNAVGQQTGSTAFEADLMVDLFEPSTAPRNAMSALEFYNRKSELRRPTLDQIADHLGISKRGAHLALKMGKEMQAKGLTDPFIPLAEVPPNASRWRPMQTA